MHADDPALPAVGVDRTIRLSRCWRRLARAIDLVMATAAKRHVDADLVWVGVRHNSTLGAAVISEDTRLPKKAAGSIAYDDTAGTVAGHKQLSGLLEHLPIVHLGRDYMHGFYDAMRENGNPPVVC